MHILLLSTHLCFSIKGFTFIFYGYQHIFVVWSKDFPLLNVYFLIQLSFFMFVGVGSDDGGYIHVQSC